MAEAQSARAYLLECCALDAAEDTERILALRRARRRGDGAGDATTLDRRSLESRLAELRREFYSLDLEELKTRLTSLKTESFLDLERYQQRLLRVAEERIALERAEQDRGVDAAFLEGLRGVLILPADERRSFRSKLERHFRLSENRKAARRTATRLRKSYPDLFALDAEWLGKFLNEQKPPRGRIFGGSFFAWMLGGMVVLRLVRFLLKWMFGDE